jgi:hypothetical protein
MAGEVEEEKGGEQGCHSKLGLLCPSPGIDILVLQINHTFLPSCHWWRKLIGEALQPFIHDLIGADSLIVPRPRLERREAYQAMKADQCSVLCISLHCAVLQSDSSELALRSDECHGSQVAGVGEEEIPESGGVRGMRGSFYLSTDVSIEKIFLSSTAAPSMPDLHIVLERSTYHSCVLRVNRKRSWLLCPTLEAGVLKQ